MNNPKYEIQITDLLADAVTNALERRNLAEMKELSDQTSEDIRGGFSFPIFIGGIFKELAKKID